VIAMEPRLNIVTLGVRNLVKVVAFYRDGLGWRQSSASVGDFAIFKLSTGTALALHPRRLLAADVKIKDHGGFGGISSVGSLLLWSASSAVSSAATYRKRSSGTQQCSSPAGIGTSAKSAAAGRWPADRPFCNFAEITPPPLNRISHRLSR
jgi:hypothetical protein